MKTRVSMAAPDLGERELAAVVEVMRSGRLALGERCRAFEEALASYVGAKHAVAVSSGTAALHLLVRGLSLGPGDEVIVPSFTFAASANAILFERATPVFCDVEPDTFNLDPADVERRIGPRTRAILAVDVFGHPAEWDALEELARRRDLRLIDDSCEALGAVYRGRPIGSIGDGATFGFYPNKQITTGEGGMLVTGDDDLAELARSLRNQGRDAMGAWLSHPRLGYNYRLDELSAAIGAVQMERIDEILAGRARAAALYAERLAGFDWLSLPSTRTHVRRSWFVYVVLLAEGLDRDPLMRALEARGIPARGYFEPLHRQPYLEEFATGRPGLPVTESVARRTVALPFHGGLTEDDADAVVDALSAAKEEVHAAS